MVELGLMIVDRKAENISAVKSVFAGDRSVAWMIGDIQGFTKPRSALAMEATRMTTDETPQAAWGSVPACGPDDPVDYFIKPGLNASILFLPCGTESFHPEDIRHRFCARCNRFFE